MSSYTIDVSDLHSLSEAIKQGLTTPEQLVVAFEDELELIEDCAVIKGSPVFANDGNAEVEYEYSTHKDAAQSYVADGDWGDDGGWVDVGTYRYGVNSDGEIVKVEHQTHLIAIKQVVPDCIDDGEHEWGSPYSIVGGLKENPGVFGNGGGVIINEVCIKCGCQKQTDTWAQHNGVQGLTTTTYTPDFYAEQVAKLKARYRVVNVNSREVLSDDDISTLDEARRVADEIEEHETEPEVEIQQLVAGEWVAVN